MGNDLTFVLKGEAALRWLKQFESALKSSERDDGTTKSEFRPALKDLP